MNLRLKRDSGMSPAETFGAAVWSLACADVAVVAVQWALSTTDPSVTALRSAIWGAGSMLACLLAAWVVLSGRHDEPTIDRSFLLGRSDRVVRALPMTACLAPGLVRGWFGTTRPEATVSWLLAGGALLLAIAFLVWASRPRQHLPLTTVKPRLSLHGDETSPQLRIRDGSPHAPSPSVQDVVNENAPVSPSQKTGAPPFLTVVSDVEDEEWESEGEPDWRSQGKRLQWTSRTVAEDGTDQFEGAYRVEFESGQKTAMLHVVLHPLMASSPELHVELTDGDSEVRWKAAAVHRYGFRLELRRLDSAESQEVVVSVRAKAGRAAPHAV